jgi:hypothetical protein
MHDEWIRSIAGNRLVKFTYLELPDGGAFLTAQIAGHEVVYSIISKPTERPFSRGDVERRFDDDLRPISH